MEAEQHTPDDMDYLSALTGTAESAARRDVLEEILFADSDLFVYAVLDAAQSSDIPVTLEGFGCEYRCLFDGQVGDDLSTVAPYLVRLTRYSDVWDWFFTEGFGKQWGIVIRTDMTLPRLKAHLKRFLRVELEDGEKIYFKFYRPEHFAAYIMSFERKQQNAIMSRLERVFCEDETAPDFLRSFVMNGEGELVSEPLPLRSGNQEA